MSTRLQIEVSVDEARELRRCAERAGLTLSEWARRALRRARQAGVAAAPEEKRPGPHLSSATILLVWTCLVLGVTGGARADEPDGWRVELGSERAGVKISDGRSTWWSGRAVLGWRKGTKGGIQGSVEPQRRGSAHDVAVVAQGYRFLGRWTVAAQAGLTPRADFYYRSVIEAELARNLGHGLVVHTAWRRLDFPSARVDLLVPALTWYQPRGELQGRVFLGRNHTRDNSSRALLVRGAWQSRPRVRLQGAVALGQRLFDVTSLAGDPQNGWIIAAGARLSVGPRHWITLELRRAHEDPSFEQDAVAVAVGRSF